jgi:serine/threonine protein kinase
LTKGDFTYLIDFGITHDAAATKVTKIGTIIGTLAYMAPERFTTGFADARADVYSLVVRWTASRLGAPSQRHARHLAQLRAAQ